MTRPRVVGVSAGVAVWLAVLFATLVTPASAFVGGYRGTDTVFEPRAGGGSVSNIAVADSGNIYVAKNSGAMVLRLSASGQLISTWSHQGATAVATDATGVYVGAMGPECDDSCALSKYTFSGNLIWTVSSLSVMSLASNGTTLFVAPVTVAFVAGVGQSRIIRLDPATGSSAGPDWPMATVGSEHFGISTMPDGGLFVAAAPQSFTLKADGSPTGATVNTEYVRNVGSSPAGSGLPDAPSSFATDDQGNVFIGWSPALGANTQVRVYSRSLVAKGEMHLGMAPQGDGPGYLSGLAASPDGHLYLGIGASLLVLNLVDPDLYLMYIAGSGPAGPLYCRDAIGTTSWLTGDPLTLNADTSDRAVTVKVPLVAIDGDGIYERTTTTATAANTYTTPGYRNIKVRATSTRGGSSVDTYPIYVAPAAPAGEVGVSINDGAEYTNSRHVTISLVWPSGATSLLLGNDGGFKLATNLTVSSEVAWTLRATGSERLPRTVYLRFKSTNLAAGVDPTKTFTDDIILDESIPVITTAALLVGVGSSNAAKAHTYRARLRAADAISGVARAQFASNKSKPLKPQKYASTLLIRTSSKPRWVRVADRAGNFSKWKALR